MKTRVKFICFTLFLMLFAACGSADFDRAAVSVDAPAPAAAPAVDEVWLDDMEWDVAVEEEGAFRLNMYGAAAYSMAEIQADVLANRRVIRNSSISMETDDFINTSETVEIIIASYGGFIENSNRWMFTVNDEDFWMAEYTLRVPVDNFDTVNRLISALGTVTHFSSTSEDVTLRFQDLESRLNIRLEEERRLLAMIENAEELEDLINLEARLADLRITIESLRRSMTDMDHLAAFSTIHLHLREVSEEGGILPVWHGFNDRLISAFGDSFIFSVAMIEGFLVFIAYIILPALLIFIPVLIVLLVMRKIKNNKNAEEKS